MREEKEEGRHQCARKDHLPPLPHRVDPANACGTKNTRDTISNPTATSSRWLSSHATSLWQNWVGTQTKRIRRVNDGARCAGTEDVERKDDTDGWIIIERKDSYKNK
jgi:hypothetical protein